MADDLKTQDETGGELPPLAGRLELFLQPVPTLTDADIRRLALSHLQDMTAREVVAMVRSMIEEATVVRVVKMENNGEPIMDREADAA